MFELDHDLAQNIVDRTMAILPYNVNVMDSQGLILGSGEPERINTRHEGAQLVLANGRVVEIDGQTAKHLKGVQPGINLPLMHDQRLIGVLGITGEPEGLRTYAELVRMTAEMLVSHRHQQAEQQWRRQRCDDLLACCWPKPATRRAWWMKPNSWASNRSWRARPTCLSWARGNRQRP
ncbi:Sugar diacid regulator [Pseudomonas sp. 35 E 8]|nr:Sugar diacid regulator [Pseudomonas sp. 35 E 8]